MPIDGYNPISDPWYGPSGNGPSASPPSGGGEVDLSEVTTRLDALEARTPSFNRSNTALAAGVVAAGASGSFTIDTGGATYLAGDGWADAPARVRLYVSLPARTLDAGRTLATEPSAEQSKGLIAEYTTTGPADRVYLGVLAQAKSNDGYVYGLIENLGGASRDMTALLTLIKLEEQVIF